MHKNTIEIINKNNLSDQYIRDEIEELEITHNRTIKKIEFVDMGDGNCKEIIEWYPVGFQRIRRITGYLVGDLSRFNDAKLSEVKDRVKHTTCESVEGK